MDEVLSAVEAALVEHFGHPPLRASVSFVGVDPLEVLRFEPIPGERIYVSLGMSRHPMSGAASELVDPNGPRAEVMLHLRDPGDDHAEVWRRVAVLAATPAVDAVVFAPGITLDLGAPLVPASRCVGVVVTESPLTPVPIAWAEPPVAHAGPTVDGAVPPVDIVQVVPATSAELAWCRVHGSADLQQRWRDQQIDLLDLTRASARLD